MQGALDEAELRQAVQDLSIYARGLYPCDVLGRSNMALKLDHCLRVFREAQVLAAQEGLSPDLARVSLWAALFHDVGRFSQYLRYATFDDRKSEDHGRLGVRVLKTKGFLRSLQPSEQKAALAAVALHNRRFLPPGLPGRFAIPAKVVRDADKLDIFTVMLAHLRPSAKPNHVVTLDLQDDPAAYTVAIVQDVMQGRLADYAKMVWLNDFRLLLCSWIYDLNFVSARMSLLQRGFVEELLSSLPDSPEMRLMAGKVRVDLKFLANVGQQRACRFGMNCQKGNRPFPDGN